VADHSAHASVEETEFLPLSQTIFSRLSRSSNHMVALGMSLHLRHVNPLNAYL
jgi:hypothetical protein